MHDGKFTEQAKDLQILKQKSNSDNQLAHCNGLQDRSNLDNSSADGALANYERSDKKSKLRQPTKFSKVEIADYSEVQIQKTDKQNAIQQHQPVGNNKTPTSQTNQADKDNKTPRVVQLL